MTVFVEQSLVIPGSAKNGSNEEWNKKCTYIFISVNSWYFMQSSAIKQYSYNYIVFPDIGPHKKFDKKEISNMKFQSFANQRIFGYNLNRGVFLAPLASGCPPDAFYD